MAVPQNQWIFTKLTSFEWYPASGILSGAVLGSGEALRAGRVGRRGGKRKEEGRRTSLPNQRPSPARWGKMYRLCKKWSKKWGFPVYGQRIVGNSGKNDVTVGSPIFRQTQIFGSSVWRCRWEQDDKWSHVTFHSSGLGPTMAMAPKNQGFCGQETFGQVDFANMPSLSQ